jgi:hypothetical protein
MIASMISVRVQQSDGSMCFDMDFSRLPCVGEWIVIRQPLKFGRALQQTFLVDQVIHMGSRGILIVSEQDPPFLIRT